MSETKGRGRTRNSRVIRAGREAVYRAFTSPDALAVWMAPGDMTAKVHQFDERVGGGYVMSLFYPEADESSQGKSGEKEDRYTARFLELTPPSRIVEAITFDSDDPGFAGEMIMDVTLEAQDSGTNVTIEFRDIPPGIKPEDNEAGTEQSLDKLARYVE